jgi:hypothetical protein
MSISRREVLDVFTTPAILIPIGILVAQGVRRIGTIDTKGPG